MEVQERPVPCVVSYCVAEVPTAAGSAKVGRGMGRLTVDGSSRDERCVKAGGA